MQIKEVSEYHSLIIDSIKEMIALARDGSFTAKQELNGVVVLVNGDSNPELIFRDQQRAQCGYIEKKVGPYPKSELTADDRSNDARIESDNERESQERQAAYDVKMKAKSRGVESKLIGAPAIELSDEPGWQKFKENNTAPYGGAVVTYSERWARLMQLEIANGMKLQDIAQSTSSEADIEGITGFMYGCAVSALAHCWKHGEQLRRWHNKDSQIGTEGDKANETGGVLNPALLTIGGA